MKTLQTVEVNLGERSYPILIGSGWIGGLGETLARDLEGGRCLIVSNPAIAGRWGELLLTSLAEAGLPAELLTIPEGERTKNLETVSDIYDFLIERAYDRKTVLIALGGGVVGDVVGFAAASFLRGVELVQAPTTLLAMVDSSVGGKTGVNHRLGKNLIGAFKQPRLVAIDLEFLSTLPDEEYRAGLAEVVKYGMIVDAELFATIEASVERLLARETEALAHIIQRSCEIKAEVVAADERDTTGRRAMLNFGHTFAHAAEALTEYGTLRHGEAVAGGMIAACRLAAGCGMCDSELTDRLGALLAALGLPTTLPRFAPERYVAAMGRDKKVSSGRMRFILPRRVGAVEMRGDIDGTEIEKALVATFESPRAADTPKNEV